MSTRAVGSDACVCYSCDASAAAIRVCAAARAVQRPAARQKLASARAACGLASARAASKKVAQTQHKQGGACGANAGTRVRTRAVCGNADGVVEVDCWAAHCLIPWNLVCDEDAGAVVEGTRTKFEVDFSAPQNSQPRKGSG